MLLQALAVSFSFDFLSICTLHFDLSIQHLIEFMYNKKNGLDIDKLNSASVCS